MSGHGHSHAQGGHTHELEWEYSYWPLVISVGILFLVLAFGFQFVYHHSMAAIISVGVGVPLIVAGISGWVSEAIGGGHGPAGLSTPAMAWFILAEAMIFMSFFVSYWYIRLSADVWPPAGSVGLPTTIPVIMTAVLILSSITIHEGELALERSDKKKFLMWLLITMVLGLLFLSMSAYEWNHLFHQGFMPHTNVFSTVFFSITGFHGAHVIVGLGIFVAILIPALFGKVNIYFLRTGSLYWHFVDIVWFFVVSQVYYW